MFSESNPPSQRVVVTAMGLVSPLGKNVAETVLSLREARDRVTPIERFDVSRTRSKAAGQVEGLEGAGGGGRQGSRLHPASLMMIAASREALACDSRFEPEFAIFGSTSGGMSFGERFFRAQAARERPRGRAGWLANYAPQKAVLDAQKACGFSAPSYIVANACASGSNAIGRAFALIRAGKHRSVLCGGYDAISELVFVGFDALQASTGELIRPFDKNRTGLALGEGAAVFFLETWDSAAARGAPVIAEITGYGISTDNYHLTQPNPSGIGPRLAMERALSSAHLRPAEIDYVNAHGTATAFNDATEGAAIAGLFGAQTPVSSTKSMMGHALGAAGAIEAAFSIVALREQFLPPNIHYQEPDPAWNLDVVANQARPANVRRVLSNSFGFGGTNASIVIEKVEGAAR